MNAAITTHNTIKKLSTDSIFTPQQAEHIVDAHMDLTKDLATKNDIKNLEIRMDTKIDKLDMKFDRKFDRLENRVDKLDTRMDSMEQKFDTKHDSLKHEIISKMWTTQIATMGIIIAAMALFKFY